MLSATGKEEWRCGVRIIGALLCVIPLLALTAFIEWFVCGFGVAG